MRLNLPENINLSTEEEEETTGETSGRRLVMTADELHTATLSTAVLIPPSDVLLLAPSNPPSAFIFFLF